MPLKQYYKNLGEYLIMLSSLDASDTILTLKIEARCKDLVDSIKLQKQNIFS